MPCFQVYSYLHAKTRLQHVEEVLQAKPLNPMLFALFIQEPLAVRAVAMEKPLWLPIFSDYLVGS